MIKKISFILVLAASLSFAYSSASTKERAVGGWLQIGNPGEHFGLDFKQRLSSTTALNLYTSFYFRKGDNSFGLYGAHYWHNYSWVKIPSTAGRLGFYAGPAGGIGWWDNDWWTSELSHGEQWGLALRIGLVGGITWEMPIPADIYMEINPLAELHFISGADYAPKKKKYRDTNWEFPDFYFRMGARFWF